MRPLFEDAQLSFDDLLGDGPEEAPAPRRLLDPAEVAARCGLSYAPSDEQANVPIDWHGGLPIEQGIPICSKPSFTFPSQFSSTLLPHSSRAPAVPGTAEQRKLS